MTWFPLLLWLLCAPPPPVPVVPQPVPVAPQPIPVVEPNAPVKIEARPHAELSDLHTRAVAAASTLTLADALKKALRSNVDLRIRSLHIAQARLDVRSHRAKLLPLLKVESTALFWNDALAIKFNLPKDLMDMLAAINPSLNASIPPMQIRDRITWQTTITLIQPLTPLLTLNSVLDLKKAEIEATRVETRMEQRKVVAEIENLYLNALKADAYLQVLDQADLLLESQRERVKALVEAKVAIPAEISRIDSAQADLDAKRARALSAILLSRQALAYLLGEPLNRYYRLVWPGAESGLPTVDECTVLAMRERPEFELLRARRRQVHEGRQAQKFDLFPRIVALTQYKYSEGFGDFEPRNQWFAGLALSWELQWTEKWRELDKLELAERELDLQTEKAERGIALEVSRMWLEVQTAQAILRARRAAERAELVSHGTQVKLFDEKLATNTDVLTAHTQWLTARVERENAQWDELAAQLAFRRTCGR